MGYIGSGLEAYHQALRDAKKYGGKYKTYFRDYYRMTKVVRKSVDLRELHGGTGTRVLTYDEFNALSKTNSIKTIINKQLGITEKATAESLQSALKGKLHKKSSLIRIRTKTLRKEEWDVISESYTEMKASGLSSKDAAFEISAYYFGS